MKMNADELSRIHEDCVSAMLSCSSRVSKYMEGDERTSHLKLLKNLAKEHTHVNRRIQAYSTALEQFKNTADASDEANTTIDLECFKVIMEKFVNEMDNQKSYHIMNKFEKATSTIQSNESSEPNSSNLVDPLTKLPLQNPVQNKICGHIYEESTIQNYIKTNSRPKCPAMGCGNRGVIKNNHLIYDENMLSKLTEASNENVRKVHEID